MITRPKYIRKAEAQYFVYHAIAKILDIGLPTDEGRRSLDDCVQLEKDLERIQERYSRGEIRFRRWRQRVIEHTRATNERNKDAAAKR